MRSARLLGLAASLWGLAFTLSLPARAEIPGWMEASVNSAAGSSSVDGSGVWSVAGSGDEIWNEADGFHFVYKTLAGDGSVTTRLMSAGGSAVVKIGVMMRDVVDDPASKVITLHRAGGNVGGESMLRALSGDG